jgi:ABC-type oligopeptide transport system substrate-binding subunit
MARRLSLSLLMFAAGAALLVAAGLASTAGSATAGEAAEARRGGTLRLGWPADDGVDPAVVGTSRGLMLQFAVCAKLFNLPDEPGAAGTRVIEEVVDRWAVSKDGKTYTFDLKRSFRFHTGARVTASSFARAFHRAANPKLTSLNVAYLYDIVGAGAVIAGKARTISGVRVLGPYRLRIRLKQPRGDFTARLTMSIFCPVLPSTPIDRETNEPPGSGPYYVAEKVPNRRIVLRRNPFYRGGRPANVDRMVFEIGESGQACQLKTEQDRIDLCVINTLPDATVRRIVEQHGINRRGGRFFVGGGLNTWFFAFNHDRPAFRGRGQIALKKAINYALDRPALVRAHSYLAGRRTDQMLPSALGRDVSIYPLGGAAPRAARRWLARARYKPTTLVLYTWNNPVAIRFGQVFEFNVEQIGIDVDVKYFEQAAIGERACRRGEAYDVAFSPLGAEYADGASFFEPLLRQPGINNWSCFRDARTNARIAAVGRLEGAAARRRAWAELDIDLMRNNPPWAPFMNRTVGDFISRSYGCYLRHPIYTVDLAAACKK